MLITYVFRKALKYKIHNTLHYSYFISYFSARYSSTDKPYTINTLILSLHAVHDSLACFFFINGSLCDKRGEPIKPPEH
jgi:hypothetical protein